MRTVRPAELRKLPVHHAAGIFPVLSGEALGLLRESLRERDYDAAAPIVVWAKTNEIVDGRNRRDLAVELKMDAVVAFVSFLTEREVAAYVVQANLARRHLRARDLQMLMKRLTAIGLSTSEVAAATGRSTRRVREVTVDEREAAKAERDEKAAQALADGESVAAAARAAGTSRRTVHRGGQNGGKRRNAHPESAPRVRKAVGPPRDVQPPVPPSPSEEALSTYWVLAALNNGELAPVERAGRRARGCVRR